MKQIYLINKWAVIITTLLFFTFWGGILAIWILALIQIVISIKIATIFKTLNQVCKNLFITYVLSTITLIVIFKTLQHQAFDALALMFVWIVVSMLLALFNLFITFKIKNYV